MLQTRDIIWGLVLLGCAAAIQVEITPTQGVISIGDSKFFLCEVVGDAKDIDWFDPRGEKINPNRQDILVTRSELTSVLTIYHASLDSAGFYKCVAKNGDEEAEATVLVEIFQKITFQDVPSPQEFNEGDDAEIICNVVSSPQPIVYWQYKGSMINYKKDVRLRLLSNNHLQIRSIKKTDEGMYNCEARVMTRGELDFRAIKVVVNVLPTIRARQSEVNATGDVGSSALLACDADGFPEPAVTWTYNNIVLETGDKYSLNEDGSELVIKDVIKVDEGDYTCTAKNKAGEKAEEVSLNVFVQAKVTYLNNQSATEFDDEVTMTCEASGDPTPTISWSFENREFTDGEQSHDRNIVVRSHARVSSLVLKNVQFTYAGQYLCTASNSIGQDSKSMYLEVRYAPKILGEVTVYTWEGNAANISCEVEAFPGASLVWFSDGVQLPNSNTTNIKIYNTPTVSYLEVTPDSQNDFGSYNCTATNVMGTESKEFLLIPADVPSSPEIQLVEPFSSTAVVVFMEPESFGGVPIIKYRVEWRFSGRDWVSRHYTAEEYMTRITIDGLRPETNYEVRMSAINGKGEGEASPPSTFKTEPVRFSVEREPAAPKLSIKNEKGNSLKVSWIKQDDGGSPIMHYLIKYKAKHVSDWKPEVRVPQSSDYAVLNGLDWDTEYEVRVVAENQQGKSKPAVISLRTSTEPSAVPGLGTGAIVGILIVVFFMLLVGIDVTCYFLNKCGLLMCIAVNFCGKAGPGAKNKDIEEGKAAFSKDESKEPIVEVRAEEAKTPNQEGVAPTEPNETTPLTEPEPAVADPPSTVVNMLPESNLVASSETNPKTTSSSTKATTEKSSPKNSPKANPQPDVGNLVDLSDTPKVAPSSDITATPSQPTIADESQRDPTKAPNNTQSKDSQVEGQKEDAPQAPSTETTTPAPTDGKTVQDDNTKGESDVKNEAAEVKTVPNEAPQANGNESKA